jgi:hypothetical protein
MAESGVRIVLPEPLMRELRFLRGWGYGEAEPDVARYLIQRGLDDLRRSGVIPPYCECGRADRPKTSEAEDE